MNTEKTIETILTQALSPAHLEVANESHKHNVPANAETHFKVVIVSQEFDGQPLLKRHRAINQLLSEQLQSGVHALSLHTMTESEWANKTTVQNSPDCKGGDGEAVKKSAR